jgi:flagellar biosynthetic protein FliO
MADFDAVDPDSMADLETFGAATPAKNVEFGRTLAKVCIFLVSLAIAGGLVVSIKRRGTCAARGKKSSRIAICDTLHLGTKHYLAVIECENRQFLVGITQNNISLLSELERGEKNDETAAIGEKKIAPVKGRRRNLRPMVHLPDKKI